MNTIAERLQQTRKELGLTQPALAIKAGVSQGTIGNIESGLRKRPREILAIASALNVNPEWLETGKGSKREAPSSVPSIPRALAWSPDIVEIVHQLARYMANVPPTSRKAVAELIHPVVLEPDLAQSHAEMIAAMLGAQANRAEVQSSSLSHG